MQRMAFMFGKHTVLTQNTSEKTGAAAERSTRCLTLVAGRKLCDGVHSTITQTIVTSHAVQDQPYDLHQLKQRILLEEIR